MQPGRGRGLLEVSQGWKDAAWKRKRFIRSLSRVDRSSLSWGSRRGLVEVYQGWTDADSAGDLEDVY